MASVSVCIANMKEAIETSKIPGKFINDNTEFVFPTLVYIGSKGVAHKWTITVKLLLKKDYIPITLDMLDRPATVMSANHKAEITVESQQVSGKIRDVVPTFVNSGKNLGKSNETNCITQAIRDALSLYNKQQKRVKSTIDTFDLNPPPMLVKKIGETQAATFTDATFADGVTVQRKLNGVHFVMSANSPDHVSNRYSRTGANYPGQEQIVSEMMQMIATNYAAVLDGSKMQVPYFDGELYVHGKTLNWISGQARRSDDDGVLEFHIFDVFFPFDKTAGFDMESRDRQLYLDKFFENNQHVLHPHVVRVKNFPVKSLAEINMLAKQFLKEQYEGAIARKDKSGYQYGYGNYHSSNLVKIKPILDDEFIVVGYAQGTRGKDVGAVIWECEVSDSVNPSDKRFTVVPKDMTYEERYAIFKCLGELVDGAKGSKITRFDRDVKGLPLTVEYSEISTKTGKPLQAKALTFRTYEDGVDIMKVLFADCLKRPHK